MKKLLIVTAICQTDVNLALERAEYLRQLKQKPDHALLLVNDGTVDEPKFKECVEAHLNIFETVIARTVSSPRNRTWPWSVNHVFRSIVRMLCANTSSIDKTSYLGWFYFEPDVTPINPDWIGIFDQQYAFHKLPFMGVRSIVHGKKGDQDVSIECMNGAGIYPFDFGRFNVEMMLADGAPWDVVGLSGPNLQQVSFTPDSAYMLTYGITECVRQSDGSIKSKKTMQDGASSESVLKLDQHIIHHGCKDGSLMRILANKSSGKESSVIAPIAPRYESPGKIVRKRRAMVNKTKNKEKTYPTWSKDDIAVDLKSGMKWQALISKYRISPSALGAIRDEVNHAVA